MGWGWLGDAVSWVGDGISTVATNVGSGIASAVEAVADAAVGVKDFVADAAVGAYSAIADEKGDYFETYKEDVYIKDEDGKDILLHKAGDIRTAEDGTYVLKDEYYARHEEDVYGTNEEGEKVLLFQKGDYKIKQYEDDVYGKDENGEKVLLHKKGDYMEDSAANRVVTDWYVERAARGRAGYSAVGDTVGTVAGMVGTVIEYGAAASIGQVARGVEWVTGTELPPALGGRLADKNREITEYLGGLAEYAWENPGRALELAGQGMINGVTSLGGMAWDVVRNVGWEYTLRHVAEGSVNIFIKDEKDKISLRTGDSFFAHTEAIHDATQWIADPIEPYMYYEEDVYELKEDGSFKLDEKGEKILLHNKGDAMLDANNQPILNENAKYERALLYGPQAVVEVGSMVVASAFTAGAGGALIAAGRGVPLLGRLGVTIGSKIPLLNKLKTARALGTAKEMRHLGHVDDAVQALDRLRKTEKLIEKGARSADPMFLRVRGMPTPIPRRLPRIPGQLERMAVRQEHGSRLPFIFTRQGGYRRALARAGEVTGDDLAKLLTKHGNKLDKARDMRVEKFAELERLAQGGSRAQIRQARKALDKADAAVKKAEAAYEKAGKAQRAFAQEHGIDMARRTPLRGDPDMGYFRNIAETSRIYADRGMRIVNPLRSLRAEASLIPPTIALSADMDKKKMERDRKEGEDIRKGGIKASESEEDQKRSDSRNKVEWKTEELRKRGLLDQFREDPRKVKDVLEELDKEWERRKTERQQQQSPESKDGDAKESYKEQFPGNKKTGMNTRGAVSPESQSGEGGGLALSFGNRARGDVRPLSETIQKAWYDEQGNLHIVMNDAKAAQDLRQSLETTGLVG